MKRRNELHGRRSDLIRPSQQKRRDIPGPQRERGNLEALEIVLGAPLTMRRIIS